MATADHGLGGLHHRWVSVDLHLAEVIACCEELVAVRMWLSLAVAVVDIGAIHAFLPDTLGGPRDRASVSLPFHVPQCCSSIRLLPALEDIIVENLVVAIVGPDVP